jgi:hypothetical protein
VNRRSVKAVAPILAIVCALTLLAFVLLGAAARRSSVEIDGCDENTIQFQIVPQASIRPDQGVLEVVDFDPALDTPTDAGPSGNEPPIEWAAGTHSWKSGRIHMLVSVDRLTGYRLDWRDSDVVWQEHGTVEERSSGLFLEPEDATERSRRKGAENVFVPLRRGECRYLVPAYELQLACEWMRTQPPLELHPVPRVLHRNADDSTSCSDEPRWPEFYRKSIVEGVTALVLDDPILRPGLSRLDRGADEGMWVGLQVRDADRSQSSWLAHVIDVYEHTSIAAMYDAPPVLPQRWTTLPRSLCVADRSQATRGISPPCPPGHRAHPRT